MHRGIELGLLFVSLACAQIPQNLDFRQGMDHWSVTGGDIQQTVAAALYRGKPVRLSAWLRSGAQLWVRVNRPNQPGSFLDNLADRPIRSSEWTRSEIMLVVAPDAESIEFGVNSLSGNPAGIRDVSFDVLEGLPLLPHNLDFAEGEPGAVPPGWIGPQGLKTSEDCHTGPSCAIVSGSLTQTLDSAPYRGKTVRLRAWVKLEPSAPSDTARLSLMGDSREIRDTEWTAYEITRAIDPGSDTISFGLSISHGGSAHIDGVFLDVVSKISEATPVSLGALPSLPSSLSALAPSIDETRQVINDAAGKAFAWIRELPNFLCTQTIRRAEKPNNNGWKADDVLTVHLGSADGKEYYKLVAVNDRATNLKYESVKGASSKGEFGGILQEIFRPGAAAFWWDSDTTLRGHPVRGYRYQIDVEKSNFELSYPRASWSRVVGHHGLVYIERDTGRVLRVIQIAFVPPRAPLQASASTIDYDYTDVGGTQYLLPLKAEVLMTAGAVQFRNEIEFHDYRKFTAESSLTFDDPGGIP